ncbi:YIP1 family protein [Acidaminobacter sp. JC074]|uniref:Yip1 family protein n=1 Tax=Acidaminobacter sp. JC074 TaxID=2530199 RepID=UPI001F0E65B6|nr:Yip1 family protein [Acidaminobacter sp. JC074]MCH4889445.1 YIP1 family protein [Acidaminobacter sp. JC074]
MSELNLNEFQEEDESLSLIQRLIMVFTDPARAFKSMRQDPKLLGIYLITGLLIFITVFLSAYTPAAKEAIIDQLQLTGQDITDQSINALLLFGAAIGGVFGILIPLLVAFIYHMIVMFMSKTGYKKTLVIYLFANLIAQIGAILSLILGRAMGTTFTFSPAMFVDMASNPLLYSIMNLLNIFSIWSLVVMYIGFKETHEMNTKEAGITVGIPALILIIFTVVTSSMAQL